MILNSLFFFVVVDSSVKLFAVRVVVTLGCHQRNKT